MVRIIVENKYGKVGWIWPGIVSYINELWFHPVVWCIDAIMCRLNLPSRINDWIPQVLVALPAESSQSSVAGPLWGLPQLAKTISSKVLPPSHAGPHSMIDWNRWIRPGFLTPTQEFRRVIQTSELLSWGPTEAASQFHFCLCLILLFFSSLPSALILKPFLNKTHAQ